LTRAFSGRLARGVRNGFQVRHSAGAPSAYPHVHHATSAIRAAARAADVGDDFNLWAGQTHQLAMSLSTAEILARLAVDARLALDRAQAAMEGTAARQRGEPGPS
jgi:nitronate monooxygenase